jgi:hypothetical protein
MQTNDYSEFLYLHFQSWAACCREDVTAVQQLVTTVAALQEVELQNLTAAGSGGDKTERGDRQMTVRQQRHCLQHKKAASEQSMV